MDLGPVFMLKVDLADDYMHVLLSPEDYPNLYFVVTTNPYKVDAIIGLHLSLLVGYIYSAAFFYQKDGN